MVKAIKWSDIIHTFYLNWIESVEQDICYREARTTRLLCYLDAADEHLPSLTTEEEAKKIYRYTFFWLNQWCAFSRSLNSHSPEWSRRKERWRCLSLFHIQYTHTFELSLSRLVCVFVGANKFFIRSFIRSFPLINLEFMRPSNIGWV